VIRLVRSALIQLSERLIVLSLIHENTCPVIAGYDSFSRTQPRHALETTQRLLVLTIESRDHSPLKMNTGVVGSFADQLFCRFSGARFLTLRQVNEHHMAARLKQSRVESKRFIERFLGGVVVSWFAGAFYHPIRIGLAQTAQRESERRIEICRALET